MNDIDRSTLATGNLKIREEFGISATAIGALQSARYRSWMSPTSRTISREVSFLRM